MPFNFAVQILRPEGVADERFAFEGRTGFVRVGGTADAAGSPVVATAKCLLAARGGCMGGALGLAAGGRDWPRLEEKEIVQFYWNKNRLEDGPFYTGRIARGLKRTLSQGVQEYPLSGGGSLLDTVPIASTLRLGFDEGFGSTNSIRGCADYIFETVLGASASIVRPEKDWVKIGTRAACAVAVKALTLGPDTRLSQTFEAMCHCAHGGDDATPQNYYALGVDGGRQLYFVRLNENTVAITVQAGRGHSNLPLVEAGELIVPKYPLWRLGVRGGLVQSGANQGLPAYKIFENPFVAGDAPRIAKQRPMNLDGFDSNEDLQRGADGYFKQYERLVPYVESFSYIAQEAPAPWSGFVNYVSTNETGDLVDQKRFWDTAEFDLAEAGPGGAVIRASCAG